MNNEEQDKIKLMPSGNLIVRDEIARTTRITNASCSLGALVT